jgi:hypothetical protein
MVSSVESPQSGGSALYASSDNGKSWTFILGADPADEVDATSGEIKKDVSCVGQPSLADMSTGFCWAGTKSGYVLRLSYDPNEPPSTQFSVGGPVHKIIVQSPCTSAESALVFAAAQTGLWRSTNGGTNFECVLNDGNVTDFDVRFRTDNQPPDVLAVVEGAGIFQSSSGPILESWLPVYTNTTPEYRGLLVVHCQQNQSGYFWDKLDPLRLYRIAYNSATKWTEISVAADGLPTDGDAGSPHALAMSPWSSGDGQHDIIFLGNQNLWRSVDSGRTWQAAATGYEYWGDPNIFYHNDYLCFAFAARNIIFLDRPILFFGTGGGVASAATMCDPGTSLPVAATDDFSSWAVYDDSGYPESLGHGKQATSACAYSAYPESGTLQYIACEDVGIIAGDNTVWRSLGDGNYSDLVASQGKDCMQVSSPLMSQRHAIC